MVRRLMLHCQFQKHHTGNEKLHIERDFATQLKAFFYSSPHCCSVESPCRHNCLDHYPAANTV